MPEMSQQLLIFLSANTIPWCHPGSSVIKHHLLSLQHLFLDLPCSVHWQEIRMEMWFLLSRNLPCDPHGSFQETISWDLFVKGRESPLEMTQGKRRFVVKNGILRNPGWGSRAGLLSISPSFWNPRSHSLISLFEASLPSSFSLHQPPLHAHSQPCIEWAGLLIRQLNLLQGNEETSQRLRNTPSHSKSWLPRGGRAALGTPCCIGYTPREEGGFCMDFEAGPLNLILSWEKDCLQ